MNDVRASLQAAMLRRLRGEPVPKALEQQPAKPVLAPPVEKMLRAVEQSVAQLAGVRAFGVDPGFANFGWAVVDLAEPDIAASYLAGGVITTKKAQKKQRVASADDNYQRMQYLTRQLLHLFEVHQPSVVCAESMSFPPNASGAAKMAYSWGILAALAEERDVPMVMHTPQEIKLAVVQDRAASKLEIKEGLEKLYPKLTSILSHIPRGRQEHPIDALAAVETARHDQVLRALRKRG